MPDSPASGAGRDHAVKVMDEDVASPRFGVVSCAHWAVGHFAPLRLFGRPRRLPPRG